MPEHTLEKYFSDILNIKDDIDKEKKDILKQLDINKLFKNPREYLEAFAIEYYESNETKLRKAVKLGENKAKKILKIYAKPE